MSIATIGNKCCIYTSNAIVLYKRCNILSKHATFIGKCYNLKQKCNICLKMLQFGVEMQHYFMNVAFTSILLQVLHL